jgi:hypothetical protein
MSKDRRQAALSGWKHMDTTGAVCSRASHRIRAAETMPATAPPQVVYRLGFRRACRCVEEQTTAALPTIAIVSLSRHSIGCSAFVRSSCATECDAHRRHDFRTREDRAIIVPN